MQLHAPAMSAAPAPDSLERIDCLDGIRAMAAVMVMFFHFTGNHGEPKALMQAAVIGQTGVDLFFVLSGFLITRILLATRSSPHFFKAFYVRRSLRIFPLYYGFLAFHFFALPAWFGMPVSPFSSQIWAWFYLQNIPATFEGITSSGPGHFWSLAIEEQFYLVWPLMVYLLPRRRFFILVLATLLVPPFLRMVLLSHGITVFYFTLTRVDALGFGALLAVMLSDRSWLLRHQRLFRRLLIALTALLLPLFVLLSGSKHDWLQTAKSSLIPALYFALIGFCITDPSSRFLTRIFSLRWLRWLGGISYGLYVFHPLCFSLVQKYAAPSSYVGDVAMSFGVTIAVAYVSFRFFETPILKLKRYFHYEPAGPAAPIRPQI
jgi:peptidoglycan/LPS O-acetylase OafA/YrhL